MNTSVISFKKKNTNNLLYSIKQVLQVLFHNDVRQSLYQIGLQRCQSIPFLKTCLEALAKSILREKAIYLKTITFYLSVSSWSVFLFYFFQYALLHLHIWSVSEQIKISMKQKTMSCKRNTSLLILKPWNRTPQTPDKLKTRKAIYLRFLYLSPTFINEYRCANHEVLLESGLNTLESRNKDPFMWIERFYYIG